MPIYTAFAGERLLATGAIEDVALAMKHRGERGGDSVLLFEDETGQQIDLDLRGTDAEALARLDEHPWLARHQEGEKRTGPGRPKLGVVAREVTLLPRHWEWLNEQPGGASVTLRKLVEETMRRSRGSDRARKARDAAARFMSAMAGNLPGYEEALRAFTRKEYEQFDRLVAVWPSDVRDHAHKLVAAVHHAEEASHES